MTEPIEGVQITISPSMLAAMADRGIALVLVRADAVRLLYPPAEGVPDVEAQ